MWRKDKIVGAVVTFFDITERKNAEQKLRQSEELLRQVTENILEVIWLSNADMTQILYVSPSYAKVWGRSCESLYENARSLLDAIHPEDRAASRDYLQKLIDGESVSHEYRIVRPDGSVRRILDHGNPIREPSGRLRALSGSTVALPSGSQPDQSVPPACSWVLY